MELIEKIDNRLNRTGGYIHSSVADTDSYYLLKQCREALDGDLENEIGELRELLASAYIKISGKDTHASDCATSDAPAYTPKECNCTYGDDVAEIPEFEGTREALDNLGT